MTMVNVDCIFCNGSGECIVPDQRDVEFEICTCCRDIRVIPDAVLNAAMDRAREAIERKPSYSQVYALGIACT